MEYSIENFEIKGYSFTCLITYRGFANNYSGEYSVTWDFDCPLPWPDYLVETNTNIREDFPDDALESLADLIQDHGNPCEWDSDRLAEDGDRLNDELKGK